jgi:hypothetical protein
MVAAIADPRSVILLRNDAGLLTATPLLPDRLPAAAPNGVRKLFQLNRVDTISALIHEAVLVPEGRLDFEWLRLLVQAVDLSQGWGAEESRFSALVGLIPTHDAAVTATVEALARLRPRLCALVDGDAGGQGYAADLLALPAGPQVIVRWPEGWTVEDVVGWILAADATASLEALAAGLAAPPASIAALIAWLKSENRGAGGLKQDLVAYETVADVISRIEPCCRRARAFLNGFSDVVMGEPAAQFVAGVDPRVMIFRP